MNMSILTTQVKWLLSLVPVSHYCTQLAKILHAHITNCLESRYKHDWIFAFLLQVLLYCSPCCGSMCSFAMNSVLYSNSHQLPSWWIDVEKRFRDLLPRRVILCNYCDRWNCSIIHRLTCLCHLRLHLGCSRVKLLSHRQVSQSPWYCRTRWLCGMELFQQSLRLSLSLVSLQVEQWRLSMANQEMQQRWYHLLNSTFKPQWWTGCVQICIVVFSPIVLIPPIRLSTVSLLSLSNDSVAEF